MFEWRVFTDEAWQVVKEVIDGIQTVEEAASVYASLFELSQLAAENLIYVNCQARRTLGNPKRKEVIPITLNRPLAKEGGQNERDAES